MTTVSYENNNHQGNVNDGLYSKRLKAGKRRTYFFDVRTTRASDYFLTITESKKKFDDNGYERHKIFLYKEDFNKFLNALEEAIEHVKTELLPDFDFDQFNHDGYDENVRNQIASDGQSANEAVASPQPEPAEASEQSESAPSADEQVDKW